MNSKRVQIVQHTSNKNLAIPESWKNTLHTAKYIIIIIIIPEHATCSTQCTPIRPAELCENCTVLRLTSPTVSKALRRDGAATQWQTINDSASYRLMYYTEIPQNYRPKQLSWFLVKNTLLLLPLDIKYSHMCSKAKKCDADWPLKTIQTLHRAP